MTRPSIAHWSPNFSGNALTDVLTLWIAASAGSVFHHGSYHRQVVLEGSQVSLQCRIPAHTIARLVMDRSDSSPGPTVMWLRTDRKGELFRISLATWYPRSSAVFHYLVHLSPSTLRLNFSFKDPSSQEVISHGDTLLVESNPRLRISYQEETGVYMLIVRNYARDIHTEAFKKRSHFKDWSSRSPRRRRVPVSDGRRRRGGAECAHRGNVINLNHHLNSCVTFDNFR